MFLLHPLTDELNIHITLLQNGYLAGLTPRGWFHIEWLHLNHPCRFIVVLYPIGKRCIFP